MNELTPIGELDRRIEKLKSRLNSEGIDGALLVQAIDVFYFSGTRQNGVLWMPVAGTPILLLRKSFTRGREESGLEDVRPLASAKELPSVVGTHTKRIGVTMDVLPVHYLNFYQKLLPNAEFVDISAICRNLRSVKSEWELTQMRMSGQLLAEAFGQIPEFLVPGMRELDFSAEFEYRLRKTGVGGFLRIRGFNQELTGIATSGRNIAAPGCFDGPVTGAGFWSAAPYGASLEVIGTDVPIFVDYGSFYNGYHADMTRIFCFGKLAPELTRAFDLSCEIQSWLSENCSPGRICEELFTHAAEMAAMAKPNGFFMGNNEEGAKFVGHGLGLELDELPIIAPKFSTPLQAGQTLALEPKFLFPGKGVVGIENTFAITEHGCKNLTPLSDAVVLL